MMIKFFKWALEIKLHPINRYYRIMYYARGKKHYCGITCGSVIDKNSDLKYNDKGEIVLYDESLLEEISKEEYDKLLWE